MSGTLVTGKPVLNGPPSGNNGYRLGEAASLDVIPLTWDDEPFSPGFTPCTHVEIHGRAFNRSAPINFRLDVHAAQDGLRAKSSAAAKVSTTIDLTTLTDFRFQQVIGFDTLCSGFSFGFQRIGGTVETADIDLQFRRYRTIAAGRGRAMSGSLIYQKSAGDAVSLLNGSVSGTATSVGLLMEKGLAPVTHAELWFLFTHATGPQDSDYLIEVFPCQDGNATKVASVAKFSTVIDLTPATSVRDMIPIKFEDVGSGFLVKASRSTGTSTATCVATARLYRTEEAAR